MTTNRNRLIFWLSMAAAQIGGFIIFKDLADISQWLVQSSRDFTMAVWYNRHWIAGLSLCLFAVAAIIAWRDRRVCPRPLLFFFVAFFAINLYSGLINPNWMFRPQQHEANFVSVTEAPGHMRQSLEYAHFGAESYAAVDDISVVVLETDNGAYAYSDYYLLQPHVAKGDVIDGEEVVMTYCGLTNLAIAYSPVIDGQQLELSVMTQLKNNLVLKDGNTGEPIQQLWGTLEGAPERGRMPEYATLRMPFRSFRELYPDGKVFVNEIAALAENPLTGLWDRLVRNVMMVWGVGLQWDDPENAAFPTISEPDPRLPMKTRIFALNVGDDFVAYTKDFLIQHGGIVNVEIGGAPVVIHYNDRYDAVAAFFNDATAPVPAIDLFGQTGDGRRLQRVNTLKSDLFWFIFAEFYPQTDVNRA
jgi:hypothetical protein